MGGFNTKGTHAVSLASPAIYSHNTWVGTETDQGLKHWP